MNRLFLGVSALVLFAVFAYFNSLVSKEEKCRIGVVVPVEHRAMDDMLQGFTERIEEESDVRVLIEVQNAQGDLNIQKAMIDKFVRQDMSLIATIGTDVSLMAINRAQGHVILGMDITGRVHQGLSPYITGVKESSIESSYFFMRELLPSLSKVAMVYSASDKNYQMLQEFSRLAEIDDIEVQGIMIQSLADLYVLAKSIDSDVDAIFIAKDHLVASGAPALAKVADELGVPFVTSDEGSVLAGATLSLGNKEKDIGKAAAEIALRILRGEEPGKIKIRPILEMTLFVDARKCQRLGIDLNTLEKVAAKFAYSIELVNGGAS